VRLLLLDDHTLFRESLSRVLEADPDFETVARCASVEEAIAALWQHLFQKTGVRTRGQLVRIAVEQFAGQWE
jgi:ActR/RegA family two-component response regulator